MLPVTAFNQLTQQPHNTACDSKLLCVVPMMAVTLYSPAFGNRSLNTVHKQSTQKVVLQNKCLILTTVLVFKNTSITSTFFLYNVLYSVSTQQQSDTSANEDNSFRNHIR